MQDLSALLDSYIVGARSPRPSSLVFLGELQTRLGKMLTEPNTSLTREAF